MIFLYKGHLGLCVVNLPNQFSQSILKFGRAPRHEYLPQLESVFQRLLREIEVQIKYLQEIHVTIRSPNTGADSCRFVN